MKAKRAKEYRKLMQQYKTYFKLRSPYLVLLDADFIFKSAASGQDIQKLVESALQGECQLTLTQCVMEALYSLGKEHQNAIDVGKFKIKRRYCHHRPAISAVDCIKSQFEKDGKVCNPFKFVLASNDDELREMAKQVKGLPVVHLKRAVVVLQPPSALTRQAVAAIEADKQRTAMGDIKKLDEWERGAEDQGLIVKRSVEEPEAMIKRKGRKLSGPNPLSVKKKKVELIKKVGPRRKRRAKKSEASEVS